MDNSSNKETKDALINLFVDILNRKDFNVASALLKTDINLSDAETAQKLYSSMLLTQNAEAIKWLNNNGADIKHLFHHETIKVGCDEYFTRLKNVINKIANSQSSGEQMEELLRLYNKVNKKYKQGLDVLGNKEKQAELFKSGIESMASFMKVVVDNVYGVNKTPPAHNQPADQGKPEQKSKKTNININ